MIRRPGGLKLCPVCKGTSAFDQASREGRELPQIDESRAAVSRPFVSGSETSEEAATRLSEEYLTAAQSRVYAAIKGAGRNGLTDLEICEQTGMKGSTVRPRRGELAAGELIVPAGRRPTPSGANARVWVSVVAAVDL